MVADSAMRLAFCGCHSLAGSRTVLGRSAVKVRVRRCPIKPLPAICAKARGDEESGTGFGRNSPKASSKRKPLSESDNLSTSRSKEQPELSEPFRPRGPTMRQEYIDRGLMKLDTDANAGVLPQAVADRMIRRIATFGGIPLGVLMIFFASYFIALYKYDIRVIPVVVAYTTLGCIGAAGIGISYGIMSSSWDEEDEGSRLGWKELTKNVIRARDGLATTLKKERTDDARAEGLKELNSWRKTETDCSDEEQ